MPGDGVRILHLFPQIQAQSFAVQVPDHMCLLPLGLLTHFRYIPISVYQMKNYSLICLLTAVQRVSQWSVCYLFRFCF